MAVGLHKVGVTVIVSVACDTTPIGVNVALDTGCPDCPAVEARAVIVLASCWADKSLGAPCETCPPGMLQLMTAVKMAMIEKSIRFFCMFSSPLNKLST
jgi:hypothetical protein